LQTSSLFGLILGLSIVAAFLFSVGCGVYIIGSNIYGFLKPTNHYKISRRHPENPRSLRAICFFFVFMGAIATISGGYGYIYQPNERREALAVVLSGLYFIGLAVSAYKKSLRY